MQQQCSGEAYGTVESAKIISDKFTGRSKGFGFIEMPNVGEAKKAIEELDGSELSGRNIVVNESKSKPQNDRRSGGGFNRGNSGYNRNRY